MSTTVSDHASDLETGARLARAVAEKFPGARLHALWKGGPRLFVADGIDADRVEVVAEDNIPMFITYVELSVGADKVRVYDGRTSYGRYATVVLADLLKSSPDAYAALVAKVNKPS